MCVCVCGIILPIQAEESELSVVRYLQDIKELGLYAACVPLEY